MQVEIIRESGHDHRGNATVFDVRVELLEDERFLNVYAMQLAIIFKARRHASVRYAIGSGTRGWIAAQRPEAGELWPESFTATIW